MKNFFKIAITSILLLLGLSETALSQEKKEVLIIGDEQSTVNYSFAYQMFDTEFVNLTFIACEGKTTGWALAELKMDTTKSYDLIILFVGLSDIYNGMNHYEIIKNYDGLISSCVSKSRRIIAVTLPYSHDVTTSSKRRYLETYFVNEFILNNTLITVVDINEASENFTGSRQLYKDNSIYLSPDGHYFLKELILNELVKE